MTDQYVLHVQKPPTMVANKCFYNSCWYYTPKIIFIHVPLKHQKLIEGVKRKVI